MSKMEMWQLQQLQNLPLDIKIEKTKLRIKEWYETFEGKVYISFSGGKDSTVLAIIARSMYPDIPLVYIDTGLEYPEIKEFVKTWNNVEIIKPKMSFRQVLEKYGYPVVSKEQSGYIQQYNNAKSEKTKNTRLNGNKWGRGKISEKWKYLLEAPFKISDQCCNILKKNPIKKYEKKTGNMPIIGVMAENSSNRTFAYLKEGCNSFNSKRPISKPLGFWMEKDILLYTRKYKIKLAQVYGEIKLNNGKLETTKLKNTGCMFCLFGLSREKEENRFQKMKKTHPKIYKYCIEDLGLGNIMDFMKINYK